MLQELDSIKKRLNVGIITPPKEEAATTPLSNLANILNALSNELYILTAGDVRILQQRNSKRMHVHKINYKLYSNVLLKVFNYLFMQIKFSIKIIMLFRDVDVWLFFLDGETLLLPVLTAKVIRRITFSAMAACTSKTFQTRKDYLNTILVTSRNINCRLFDRIIIYSRGLINEWQLEKYANKISIAHEHFLDFNNFRIIDQLSERNNIVGYIGRLSYEKGVLTFVHSIPRMVKRKCPCTFMIGGDGLLYDEIKDYLTKNNLFDEVKLTGWISHEKMPLCLNRLKLLVIPSFSEGLPNILLEAMACGTPIIASPVGAISVAIKDGETGFYLRSNDPEYIAEKIIELLSKPDLLKSVSIKARRWVFNNFGYTNAFESWRKVFNSI